MLNSTGDIREQSKEKRQNGSHARGGMMQQQQNYGQTAQAPITMNGQQQQISGDATQSIYQLHGKIDQITYILQN